MVILSIVDKTIFCIDVAEWEGEIMTEQIVNYF